jgi:hypothetical protein
MTAILKAVVGIAITGVAILSVVQYRTGVRLGEENQSLRQQLDQLAQKPEGGERTLATGEQPTSPSSTSNQFRELLKLRGEVGVLRRETNEIGRLKEEISRLRRAMVQSRDPRSDEPIPRLASVGPAPSNLPDDVVPAGSIVWVNADLKHQVLPIFAEMANVELDADAYFKTLPSALISFSNSTALTESEAIEMIERALRDQAGIEIVRQGTNRAVVRPRR